MEKTRTIGFDGMHRCGKGTQIGLYSKILEERQISYIIRRGDGSRRGIGNEPQDPFSVWWRDNSGDLYYLEGLSTNQKVERINLAYQRLNREIIVNLNRRFDRLILDRTFISRFFVMRQYFPNITLEDSIKVYNPKSGKLVPVIIPERLYLLNVNKDTLIERCNCEDFLDKKDFRRRNIENHYGLFMRILKEIQELDLGCEILIIDGTKDSNDIHREIIKIEGLV